MIFVTSDLHFNHNREFLYKPRGFSNVYEMNRVIVQNWNSIVSSVDEVYILGDLMLNDNESGIRLLNQLNGEFHIILGNHDTDARVELYNKLPYVVEIAYATRIKYRHHSFYLSHYPTIITNPSDNFRTHTIGLFGHTHSKEKFYDGNCFMYNVSLDANDCAPVSIEDIIERCREKYLS